MSTKNVILRDKDGNQLAPATIADQVSYDGTRNVRQAIEDAMLSPIVENVESSSTENVPSSAYVKNKFDMLNSTFVREVITLAENVTVTAESTTDSYSIPDKTGYSIAAVTPMVSGAYYGVYSSALNGNTMYFKNNSNASHTNTFKAIVLYMKN